MSDSGGECSQRSQQKQSPTPIIPKGSDAISTRTWVQLYIGDTKSGNAIKITPIPDDVYDLTKAVKEKFKVKLSYCDAGYLCVYPAGTAVSSIERVEPTEEGQGPLPNLSLSPGHSVPTDTTCEKPLVVVAPPPPEEKQSDMASMEKRIVASIALLLNEKNSDEGGPCSLSRISSEVYEKVVTRTKLKVKAATWGELDAPSASEVDALPVWSPFAWLDAEEDSAEQRKAYKDHLQKHIRWPSGHAIDVTPDKNLLTINADKFFNVKGNVDVTVARTANIELGLIKQNIKAQLELKKSTVTKGHQCQAEMQHLAASCLNETYGVLTVLTNLNSSWQFYWFHESGVLLTTAVEARHAKYLLEHMFDSPDTQESTTLFPEGFLARGTWFDFVRRANLRLKCITEEGERDAKDEDSAGSGEGEYNPNAASRAMDRSRSRPPSSSQRAGKSQKLDKAGSKGGGAHEQLDAESSDGGMDVANELDLLEFADEEEKRAIVFNYVVKHAVPEFFYRPYQNDREEGDEDHVLSEANLSRHNASTFRF